MNARKDKSDLVRTWLPSLVGVGGLLFGVTTFYLQYIYLPQREPRSLEVRSSLEKEGENRKFVVIKGTIKVRNITKTRVEMLGAFYNVGASTIEAPPDEISDADYSKSVDDQLRAKGPITFARHYQQTEYKTILASRFFDDTAWFDAAQEYEYGFHVYVPRDRYDLLQLQVVMVYAKDRGNTSLIWKADEYGGIQAIACRKLPDFQKDQTKCEQLDPDSPEYEKIERKYGLAQNDSLSELDLLRTSTTTSPPHKKSRTGSRP